MTPQTPAMRKLHTDAATTLRDMAMEKPPRGRRARAEWIRKAQVYMSSATLLLQLAPPDVTSGPVNPPTA